MRQFSVIIILLLSAIVGFAQNTTGEIATDTIAVTDTIVKPKYTFGTFFNHLTLPLELGCAWSAQVGEERPGFYFRTSLEYRDIKTASWVVAIEYDTYTRKYENYHFDDNNTISGDEIVNDIFVGGGYRFPLLKNWREYLKNPYYDNVWSLCLMAYVGTTNSSLKNVTTTNEKMPDGNPAYILTEDSKWVPSMKLQVVCDYSIDYSVNIFFGCAYMQHFMHTKLETNYAGMFIVSGGITCFFR